MNVSRSPFIHGTPTYGAVATSQSVMPNVRKVLHLWLQNCRLRASRLAALGQNNGASIHSRLVESSAGMWAWEPWNLDQAPLNWSSI